MIMTIRQLLLYLQSAVTLMANLVLPSENDRLRDKGGKKALTQSTSMIMVVSLNLLSEFFLSVVCFFPYHFSLVVEHYGSGLGLPGL